MQQEWDELVAKYRAAQAASEVVFALDVPVGRGDADAQEAAEEVTLAAAWAAGDAMLTVPAPDIEAVIQKLGVIVAQGRALDELTVIERDLRALEARYVVPAGVS